MAKISDEVRGVCPKICHPSWCQEKKTRTTLAFRAILTIIVEMEGFEPSSKRGTNKLSTCLVIDLIFVLQQAHDYQLQPYPLNFKLTSRLCEFNSRIFQHHLIETSRDRAIG